MFDIDVRYNRAMHGIEHWRHQRFHVSYLLGWLSLGLLLGLLLAKWQHLAVSPLGALVFVLCCMPSLRTRRWWTIGIIIAIGITIGMARGSYYGSEVAKYEPYFGKTIEIMGRISTDPQAAKTRYSFQVDQVKLENEKYPGELYITVPSVTSAQRGDVVRLRGALKPGFATYHGSMSGATVLASSRSPDVVRDIRERFVASVRHSVVEPMASLGIGFVVGQRTALSNDLDDKLKIVGLTHIVVASGYNLTILVRFARRLFARHSRYLAFVLSLALMLAFVAFSGLSPSMNRAVAVTGLSLLAWYYGRRFHPLLLIGFVASGTAIWNPIYVWSDLGWYLSFFAFAGVLIIAPLVTAVLFRKQDAPAFIQLVIETLSAELMTLPLIAFAFGTFPTFGLLANILVGPVIPFAMLATTLAGITGMVLPAAASILAVPASVIIGYVIAVVEILSGIEWAQLPVSVTPILVCGWFAFLLIGALYIWRHLDYNFRSSAITD